jgi:transcription antitermination factor NusG
MNNNIDELGNDALHFRWYALYTKPRHEFKAAEQLSGGGFDFYLPVIKKLKQWSDRKKIVEEPLIRGYIFVHADEKERYEALQNNAVINCVFFNGRPAAIPDWQIESLKKMLESGEELVINDVPAIGQKVKITSGPFTGVIGVVKETLHGKSISLTLDWLNRSVTALIPLDSITKDLD